VAPRRHDAPPLSTLQASNASERMPPDNGQPKATAIRENTPEKEALIALFEKKKWERFPKKLDPELEALMKTNNWNKNQVSRHFGIWFRLGVNANRSIERSREVVLASLKEKCDSAGELLKRTWESPDIVPLVGIVSFPAAFKEKMNDTTIWEGFMNDIFDKIADNRASSGNRVPHSTAQYGIAKELLVHELWKKIGSAGQEGTTIHDFFYLFAKEFVSQLHCSFAEPNVAEIEAAVVSKILQRNVALEPRSYAQTLYFILGFIATAVFKEGKRRKSKGYLFTAFAERNCLGKESIVKARESGELPMEKTTRIDKGGLRYPTRHFYLTMTKVEQIYCSLLTDDNLVAYGPSAMKRLDEMIYKNDTIRAQLSVAIGKKAEGADTVIDFVLKTFRRVRGSDYTRKLLARTGKSYATATRTALQVKSEAKKSQKVDSSSKSDEVDDDCDFERECAEKLEEMIECRTADEDQLVRKEVDCDSSSEEESSDYEIDLEDNNNVE